MENKIELDSTGKGLGLCMIASAFLEQAGRILKADNTVYKQRNKFLIDNFLRANLPIIEARELIANLIVSKKVLEESSAVMGYELDPEVVLENYTSEQTLLSNMIYLYLCIRSDEEMANLLLVTENLRQDKRVYTQEDVLWKIECAVKDFCNMTDINTSLLTKYL